MTDFTFENAFNPALTKHFEFCPFPAAISVFACPCIHFLITHTHTHTHKSVIYSVYKSARGKSQPTQSQFIFASIRLSLCELPVSYHHDSWSGQPVNVTQCSPSAQAQKARNGGKKREYKRREKKRGRNAASLSQLEECKHVSAQKTTLQHADKHTHTHTHKPNQRETSHTI